MKKILVIGVLVLGGLWACKKTHLCSYASTLWNQGQRAVNGQIPRDLKLDRIQNEIDKLDSDVRAMLGPVAEKQAAIKKLQRDIENARAARAKTREELLALTQQVEARTANVSWGGETLPLEEAKARLAQEFALFKAMDGSLKSREQILAAQKQGLRFAHAQLKKINDQKNLFQARLNHLKANEENLKLQEIASPSRVDESRVADIKNSLDDVEEGQEVALEKRVLDTQYGPRPRGARPQCCPSVNTQEVRSFLGAPTTTTKEKVVSSK